MHLLMMMPYSLLLIISVIVIEKLVENDREKIVGMNRIMLLISGGILAIIIYNYGMVANTSYTSIHQRYEKTYGTMLRLIDRIEQTEGYTEETPILFKISKKDETEKSTEAILNSSMTGMTGKILYGDVHIRAFATLYLDKKIVEPSQEQINLVMETKEYSEIPLWPNKDCIEMIQNTIVVHIEL